MVRNIGGFVAGVLAAGLLVMTLQQLSSGMHPLPEGLDPFDPAQADAFRQHLSEMPAAAWVIGMLSEVIGFFVGALVAGWIIRGNVRAWTGAVVGVGVLGSVYNWTQFEHPTWFIVAQVILYPLALVAAWAILERARHDASSSGAVG